MHHVNYTIPHYRAQEYTVELKKVLGEQYLYDPMPIINATLRCAKECVYVKSVEGTQFYEM
jgi:omega-6 fatty acid desaturase (delta-12 desaturase)